MGTGVKFMAAKASSIEVGPCFKLRINLAEKREHGAEERHQK
jgi:hypothetical protein